MIYSNKYNEYNCNLAAIKFQCIFVWLFLTVYIPVQFQVILPDVIEMLKEVCYPKQPIEIRKFFLLKVQIPKNYNGMFSSDPGRDFQD